MSVPTIRSLQSSDAYMTIADVSVLLCIKEKTIRQWIYQGKIPSIKINGLVRFRKRDIDTWIEALARSRQ